MTMKVIPAIDIMGGRTVRLEQGRYDRRLRYDIAPVDAAREWESRGAELIHVVDLDGARDGWPVNLSVVSAIAQAVNIPVEAGGGFRNEADIEKALGTGIWRVVVGSKALEEKDFARNILENFREQVIPSLDADKDRLRIHGWKKPLDLDIFKALDRFVSYGAGEVIYTAISKDGTLAGPDTGSLKKIIGEFDIGFIYAGGVKNVEHIRELKELEHMGLTGVIVGRALYDGTLDLGEAINACKADNPMP